ncbi:MAG TPA: hypothetical protein VFA44_03845 [Gaiellaceae bacterium]|nr:hypothetical protein [Gaiellaceae bacterium]
MDVSRDAGARPAPGPPRSRRGFAGAALSASVLCLGVGLLVARSTGRCGGPTDPSVSVDLTPLVFFALTSAALVLDLVAVRRGARDARWGRIGLLAVSGAALLGIWQAADASFRLSGCA